MRFQKGDRVRVGPGNGTDRANEITTGRTGTVATTRANDEPPTTRVKLDNPLGTSLAVSIYTYRLTLIESNDAADLLLP